MDRIADIALRLVFDHLSVNKDRLSAGGGIDSGKSVVVNIEFQQLVVLKVSRNPPRELVMVQAEDFDATVADGWVGIGDGSAELVVVHPQIPELYPFLTNVVRECPGEFVPSEVCKVKLSEPHRGNRPGQLVRIEIQVTNGSDFFARLKVGRDAAGKLVVRKMQMSYVPPIPDAARNGTGQLVLEKVHPLEFSDAIEGFGNGSTEIVSGKIQDLQIPEQLDLGRNGPRQSVVGKPDFFHRPDVVSFVVANDPVPPALVDVLYADRVGLFVVQVVPGHKVVVHPPLPVLQKGDAARGAVECIVQCQ
eukprot:CAMPEP_0201134356 /NCGR_PEP_ID=MMETSP0850-20130426/51364_1 /ASSEMBLY_ACC=CAM_ASM_000622 /TAXON_ID=183588 /ORGANISM="Pseudo-nitzschia fraudulenta, Strain WWA7" /LENGTH=304 /DNA_ID=CAMNT_0047405215 /DNA_START=195 /DNA_END=1107 /DNA_ORIENTATION=+